MSKKIESLADLEWSDSAPLLAKRFSCGQFDWVTLNSPSPLSRDVRKVGDYADPTFRGGDGAFYECEWGHSPYYDGHSHWRAYIPVAHGTTNHLWSLRYSTSKPVRLDSKTFRIDNREAKSAYAEWEQIRSTFAEVQTIADKPGPSIYPKPLLWESFPSPKHARIPLWDLRRALLEMLGYINWACTAGPLDGFDDPRITSRARENIVNFKFTKLPKRGIILEFARFLIEEKVKEYAKYGVPIHYKWPSSQGPPTERNVFDPDSPLFCKPSQHSGGTVASSSNLEILDPQTSWGAQGPAWDLSNMTPVEPHSWDTGYKADLPHTKNSMKLARRKALGLPAPPKKTVQVAFQKKQGGQWLVDQLPGESYKKHFVYKDENVNGRVYRWVYEWKSLSYFDDDDTEEEDREIPLHASDRPETSPPPRPEVPTSPIKRISRGSEMVDKSMEEQQHRPPSVELLDATPSQPSQPSASRSGSTGPDLATQGHVVDLSASPLPLPAQSLPEEGQQQRLSSVELLDAAPSQPLQPPASGCASRIPREWLSPIVYARMLD